MVGTMQHTKKIGDQKLVTKNVAIETCGGQNLWQLNSCGDQIF